MTFFVKQLHLLYQIFMSCLSKQKAYHPILKVSFFLLLVVVITLIMISKWETITITTPLISIIGISLLLSLYDIFYQEYPFIIWLVFTLMTIFFYPLTLTAITLFLLALLAEFRDIKIGSGDLFYLGTISLTITIWQLSWLIQLASLMGILMIFLGQNNKKPIPFIPFLTLAYCLIL